MKPEYTYRKLEREDLEQLARLQLAVFSKRRELAEVKAILEWKYFRNPVGEVIGSVSVDTGGRIVGVYAGIPLRVQLGDDFSIVYHVVASAVLPEARGRGIFSELYQNFSTQLSNSDSSRLYVGFPNPLAFAIGGEKFGYHHLLSISKFRLPLTILDSSVQTAGISKSREPIKWQYARAIRSVLNRIPLPKSYRYSSVTPSFVVTEISNVPEDMSQLWERIRKQYRNTVVRDREYLTWRLVEQPYVRNRLFEVRSENVLVGFFALELGEIVQVVDFLCDKDLQTISSIVNQVIVCASQFSEARAVDWLVSSQYCMKALLPFAPRLVDVSSFVVGTTSRSDRKLHDLAKQSYDWYLTGNEYTIG